MANKRIRDLTERTTLSSGDYLATDNSSGTRKVNASKILTPISTAQSTADLVTSRVNNSGDAFSSSKGYDVGALVVAPTDNLIYRCKTAYSKGASWNSRKANFEQISMVKAVDSLNSALIDVQKLQTIERIADVTGTTKTAAIDYSLYSELILTVIYASGTSENLMNFRMQADYLKNVMNYFIPTTGNYFNSGAMTGATVLYDTNRQFSLAMVVVNNNNVTASARLIVDAIRKP